MRTTVQALQVVLALTIGLAWAPRGALAGPAILFDADNGQVLYAEDVDDAWYPASLTKIMTAYLAFEALKAGKLSMEQKLTVSDTAHAQPPSKVGLPIGNSDLTVELALQALIIKSANDVAVMLAEAIAGSEPAFVAQMNETARRLGMTRTTFANPHGLPPAAGAVQTTSARDLAKLSRAVVRDFPTYAAYWKMDEMRLGAARLRTHNTLLKSFDGADGLKTGFTCDSGYNVVASATRADRRLMAVVLGEPSGQARAVRATALLDHGFSTAGWKSLFNFTTVDNILQPPEAKPLTSVRATVLTWSCGHRPKVARGRKPAKVAAIKQKVAAVRAKAAKAAKAEKAVKTEKSERVEKKTPATEPAASGGPAKAVAGPKPAQTPAPPKPVVGEAPRPKPASAAAQ